eukprot:TRINITY_DN20800_c0_g2_i1.p2 TRINITY_DN20800_c0_g2~~TRINITY_DN20800_c0_g2_i1.p2  ORF type:complete len:113 (-),score=31.52 TRINITY_DN20800_c0_g2_i1:97-435(-)
MCIRDRYQRRVHGVHVLCYFTLKYMVVLQQFIGLLSQIEKIKITSENRSYKYRRNGFEIFDIVSKPKVNTPPKTYISYPSLSYMPLPQRNSCLLYTSPSPRDLSTSRMPSSA